MILEVHLYLGKAARDMFFKVLALECPELSILNYAPGPLQTKMFHKLRTETHDEEIRTQFNGKFVHSLPSYWSMLGAIIKWSNYLAALVLF